MTKHILKTQKRTVSGRQVKKLRAQGLTPAHIFGKKVPSVNIQVNTKEFLKLFSEVGESTLVYLQIEGDKEERPVLVRDTISHPVGGHLLHISFNQVDLKEKVTAPVSIKLEGEAPAEAEKIGILVQQLDEVELEALPTDMPEHIALSISGLAEVGSALTVADIKLDSSKITIKTDPETIIAKIEPLAAEEVETPPAPVAGEEGVAPAEGETPAETGETLVTTEEKAE